VVSDGFFRTLGVAPGAGRDFRPGEDRAGRHTWCAELCGVAKNRYGGRQDIVVSPGHGQPFLHGYRLLPRGFSFCAVGPRSSGWTLQMSLIRMTGEHGIAGIARLKDGIHRNRSAA